MLVDGNSTGLPGLVDLKMMRRHSVLLSSESSGLEGIKFSDKKAPRSGRTICVFVGEER